jgi:hypothetical protein
MWTLGHSVREIERSHHQVIVEETATTVAAVVFGAFALLTAVVFRSIPGGAVALTFGSLGLYASVRSSFTADRDRRVLVIRRRVGWWALEKTYEAKAIDRIYVVSTRKGDGLAVRFKSGRHKNLTLSLGSSPTSLGSIAASLTEFLYTPKCR